MSQAQSRKKPMNLKVRLLLVITGILSIFVLYFVSGCMSLAPPSNTENLCLIFAEKRGWYRQAKRAEDRWDIPKTVLMSIINQESSFVHNALPPRTKILGLIPWKRPSTAYGYAQALDITWNDYQARNNRKHARRTRFKDAIDFVGWYLDMAARATDVSRDDAKNLYVIYHEGITGFESNDWKKKRFLLVAATKVENRVKTYETQLANCDHGPARRR